MRAKVNKLIVTFHTTAGAIAMEKECKKAGIPGRLIPVPRSITSDCGMSWCSDPDDRAVIEAFVKEKDMEYAGFYEVLV